MIRILGRVIPHDTPKRVASHQVALGSAAGMSDRRYSTARWQRLRKAVLAYYGYVCQVEGPRCTGYATTVHHILPSSQYPNCFGTPRTWKPPAAPATTATARASQRRTRDRRSSASALSSKSRSSRLRRWPRGLLATKTRPRSGPCQRSTSRGPEGDSAPATRSRWAEEDASGGSRSRQR
jgi:hypothetical protein